MKASQSIAELVTNKELEALKKLSIESALELLNHFPKRYEDRRRFDAFPSQAGASPVCVRGVVIDSSRGGFGGRKSFYEITIMSGKGDHVFAGGKLTCRWFNMPYISKMLAAGHEVIVYGKVKDSNGRLIIDHPEFEVIGEEGNSSIHVERIVPVYKLTSGIQQRRLREIVWQALELLDAESIVEGYSVDESYPKIDAYKDIHFPEVLETQQAAQRYFALEEFFHLQLAVAYRKYHYQKEQGRVMGKKKTLLKKFYDSLPFDLTGAQKRSVKEIAADMERGIPMHRMLQGDVGSGKTFVALCAALLAVESGAQVAMMAPTQILAEQHYLGFKKWLDPLGVKVGLCSGNRREGIQQADIIVGTHALLYDDVFNDLGLVIVDEQHKFGVQQRRKLVEFGRMPDVLVMTATPIPRTLTLTIYGDLDVSLLDERPAGRGTIITGVRVKPKVSDVTKFIRSHIDQGRQAYIVYPLVEESETLSAESAIEQHGKWTKRFSKHQVGLLHGKMKPEEKEEVMRGFREAEIQVLVATTVIEVGVDVPNANMMVIYNAERFGLAQLHQLRGRIGRGEHKSYCILVTDGKSEQSEEKLSVMAETTDGFKIAEADLKLRGPGDVLGTQQSGVSELRFIEYLSDVELIREARSLADTVIQDDPELKNYPDLAEIVSAEISVE